MTEHRMLDHPPIRRALNDPSTHDFLKSVLSSSATLDPVDVLHNLEAARDLISSYLGALCTPHMGRTNP